MAYNLFITTASGRTFTAARSPYPDRDATQRTVAVTVASTIYDEDIEKQENFARRVASAPLGETVTHPATGISFRTEEVQS